MQKTYLLMEHSSVAHSKNYIQYMGLGQYIPIVFCHLLAKSVDCYREIFTFLAECCEKYNLRMNFTTLHVDFEERMLVVVKEFFQTTSSKHVIFTSASHGGEKI